MSSAIEFIQGDPQFFLDTFSSAFFDFKDIFISPDFVKLQSQMFPCLSFGCLDIQSRQLVGLGHFAEIEPGFFRSPGRGTYGGLRFFSDREIGDFYLFAKFVHDELQKRGAGKIEVVLPPAAYTSSRVSEWINAWYLLGFKLDRVDLNYSIATDIPDYKEKVVHAVRKRINKCHREGFLVQEEAISNLPAAYEIIKKNRESKGFPVTMTLEQLTQTALALPGRIQVFTVQSSEGLRVASAIVYSIDSDTNYVFYWGDLPGYSNYSFVTLLADHLYQRNKRDKKSLLDLGVSTLRGVPNPGLVKFKVNLGASVSLKLTVSKEL